MSSLVIFGRQPALGMAELESLYGADVVRSCGRYAAYVSLEPSRVEFARLGGSVRLCRLITTLPSASWPKLRDYLLDEIPARAAALPEGKVTIGLSLIGIKASSKDVERCLLSLKKMIKSAGRPARIVPNKNAELNTAQVIHNNLTGTHGIELVAVADGSQIVLAQTTAVQDIEAYAARDQARPYRDARVGMLPPKLAQIIINLATGPAAPGKQTVLDPFCGTGVVLQEATLMGYDVYGTDIEPRMIEYSIGNLHWLRETQPDHGDYVRIEVGDATKHTWHQPVHFVAGETYLGQPYATLPPRDQLLKNIRFVDQLHRTFLQHIGRQLRSGTRLCLGVPAWNTLHGFLHLPVLDHLKELGYNHVQFVHARQEDLIYHRSDQVVGRELVVLEKV